MSVLIAALAASLGAAFMAVLHEIARWDASRRLAARMEPRPAAAGLYAPAPAGRHRAALAPLPTWDGNGQRTPAPDPGARVYA